ncbi:MAG: hypothetical protein JWL79_2925 [Frankiales bacterium]|nr:hypothetical protein [Frankiales bacterium]
MDRVQLLRDAALDARQRLTLVGWQMDERELFAPLGETLMWLSVLSDALGVSEDDPYSGLKHARNALVHGESVVRVTDIAVQGSWEPNPLKGGVTRRVRDPAKVWGFVDDPNPASRGQYPKREASYDRSVAGWELWPRLDSALHDLGVDILGAPVLPPARRRRRE